jgi:hypothetical protein
MKQHIHRLFIASCYCDGDGKGQRHTYYSEAGDGSAAEKQGSGRKQTLSVQTFLNETTTLIRVIQNMSTLLCIGRIGLKRQRGIGDFCG